MDNSRLAGTVTVEVGDKPFPTLFCQGPCIPFNPGTTQVAGSRVFVWFIHGSDLWLWFEEQLPSLEGRPWWFLLGGLVSFDFGDCHPVVVFDGDSPSALNLTLPFNGGSDCLIVRIGAYLFGSLGGYKCINHCSQFPGSAVNLAGEFLRRSHRLAEHAPW